MNPRASWEPENISRISLRAQVHSKRRKGKKGKEMGERSQEERCRVGRRKQKMPGHSEECGQSNVCRYSQPTAPREKQIPRMLKERSTKGMEQLGSATMPQ